MTLLLEREKKALKIFDPLFHLEPYEGSPVALCGYVFKSEHRQYSRARRLHDCQACWEIHSATKGSE